MAHGGVREILLADIFTPTAVSKPFAASDVNCAFFPEFTSMNRARVGRNIGDLVYLSAKSVG